MSSTRSTSTTSTRRTPAFLTISAIALMLAIALIRGLAPFAEVDVWWHLRVGEHILDTHQLYGTDPWAGFADRPYLATQWLTEAVAAQGYRWFGYGAVLWLRTAAILGVTLFVYAAARRLSGRLPAALATGVALLGASASLNPRPQLVSFLMFAIVMGAWVSTTVDLKPRWWLIPLYWVWACCHALWVFGILLGIVTSVALLARREVRATPRLGWKLLALNAGTAAAVALTPLGPRLLLAPFTVANNAAWVADEWAATPLSNPFSIAAVGSIVVTALCWLWRPAKRPLWQYAWLGLSAALTLYMWRLVPLGAMLCAPLLASALQSLLTGRRERVGPRERHSLLGGLAGALTVAALVCAGPAGAKAFLYPSGMGGIDRALARVPDRSVVLADFGVSGWMLWTHPQLVPTADLRGEIYSTDYLHRYISATSAAPGWQAFLRESGARYALVERTSAIGDALTHEKHWQKVASSPTFVLLSAPGSSL